MQPTLRATGDGGRAMATEFEFDLPRGFGPVPLDPSPIERAEHARRILSHLGDNALGDRQRAVDGLVIAGEMMRAQGARVAGQLTIEDVDPDVTASFMLAIHDLPDGGVARDGLEARYELVAALVTQLQQRHRDQKVRAAELSSGPAVISVRAGHFQIPAERMTTGIPISAQSYGIQIMVPDPSGDRLIIIDVSTHHTEHWKTFVTQAVSVSESIKFAQRDDGRLA